MANATTAPYEETQIACGRGVVACRTWTGPRVRVVEYEPIGGYDPHPDRVVQQVDRRWGAEGKSIFVFTKFGREGMIVGADTYNVAIKQTTVETLKGPERRVYGKRRRVRGDVYQALIHRIERGEDVDPDLVETGLTQPLWLQYIARYAPGSRPHTHWNPASDRNAEKVERELRRGHASTSGHRYGDWTSPVATRGRVDSDKLRRSYGVLGVKEGASLAECKAARQARLRTAHPDQGGEAEGAAQLIEQIKKSYEYIEEWHPREGRRASELR